MNFDELSLTFAMEYDILKTEFENQSQFGETKWLYFGVGICRLDMTDIRFWKN